MADTSHLTATLTSCLTEEERADTSHLTATLTSCLTEERAITIEKSPVGLDRALDTLHESDDVSRAFLKAGFVTWYAYFVATDETKQAASRLSPAALQHVVNEVSKITPHDSVGERINHILFCHRGNKRRSEVSKVPYSIIFANFSRTTNGKCCQIALQTPAAGPESPTH
jgi:hypothetical protein